MLGKGLESLIPPQDNNLNNQNQNSFANLNSSNNSNQNQNLNTNNQNPNQTTNQNDLSQNSNNFPSEENLLLEDKEEKLLHSKPEEKELTTPKKEFLPQNPENEEKLLEEEKILPENNEKFLIRPENNNLNQNNQNIKKNNAFPDLNYKSSNFKNNYQKGEAIFHIEVSKIKPNPHQPRRDFNEKSINELAESIRQFGIIQPLVVKKIEKEVPTGTEVEYQIIAGERRWLAAKKLGLETVPAIIRKVDIEQEGLELAVIENIQRENLNPIETARAFARLQDEFRLTQREIATRLGKSREAIANALRLLDLPQEIQDAIATGKISESHGRLLLTINDPVLQKQLFEDLLRSNLTTRELKYKINVSKIKKHPQVYNQSLKISIDPEIKILEEKLKLTFGTPVKISREGKTGKIIIEFYSDEELKNIISRLAPDKEN
jgi:ParB family chromosome partitioning protein